MKEGILVSGPRLDEFQMLRGVRARGFEIQLQRKIESPLGQPHEREIEDHLCSHKQEVSVSEGQTSYIRQICMVAPHIEAQIDEQSEKVEINRSQPRQKLSQACLRAKNEACRTLWRPFIRPAHFKPDLDLKTKEMIEYCRQWLSCLKASVLLAD